SGRTLLQRKLKRWVALGALNAYDRPEVVFSQDWNFFRNGTAKYTALLVNELDVPSYFIDAGSTVMTGSSLIPTPSGNIVRTAYRDWLWNVFNHTMEQQRPSWDLAAVFFAAEGYGDFLTKGEEGYLSFDSLQGSRWIPGESHRPHHYIRQKPGTDETFADYLNQKISSVPSF
ncbi:MAG: nucleoside hydrolase, partial [Bacteroidota bacterium]